MMLPTENGSFRLFRFAGIDVWLHWSWVVVALWVLSARQNYYSTMAWNAAEYLTLFGIVLLHEYGHALACRQVGGQANKIILWPLGGVAYVAPPYRPWAHLWSIAAGPLVNVALVPVIHYTGRLLILSDAAPASPDFWRWLGTIQFINYALLIFNWMPVYPLDGGQIVRSLLWFKIGPRKSLLVASGIGLVGAAGLLIFALSGGRWWLAIMAGFLGSNAWRSFKDAKGTQI
ncbi:MAG: site-2 protease family protein [Candidatus Synoicihabitans palmerolidicus]|nr:site-2 protease family protein [Candidatus Synoicihabitans palmerolidicus]